MIDYLVVIVIGIILLILALVRYRKRAILLRKGILSEGIIFDVENANNSYRHISYPVVRFLTKNQEWITVTSDIATFPNLYKTGQKVRVIYDSDNPKEFMIDSKMHKFLIYCLLISGVLLIITGVYKILLLL